MIVVLWQFIGAAGYLNSSIVPTPSKVANSFAAYLKNGLLHEHFFASIGRVLSGFAIGGVAGLILGVLLGLFRKFERASVVVLGSIRPIPMVGLVPLFILWFGIGEKSKILVIAIGALWPILLNTENGIRNTDPKQLEVAKILKKNQFFILRKIILPGAVPLLVTGIRLGLSNAWRGVVAAEMIGATRGVGYMISYARELAQPSVMFVGLFIIGIVGILIDVLLFRFQKRLIRWA
ncbi:MAG: ABC transporter permease [Spirochaetia bacterium]|nr:ABC transporter permease [Spirochaetia bacterium]